MKKYIPIVLGLMILALPVFAIENSVTAPEIVICNVMNTVKTILLAVGIGLAVILLIVGGIKYMTSQGDPEKAKSARAMIINALIGVAIMLIALFLIGLVQNFLTDSGINILRSNCQNQLMSN